VLRLRGDRADGALPITASMEEVPSRSIADLRPHGIPIPRAIRLVSYTDDGQWL